MNSDGWIKLYRQFVDWELYTDDKAKSLFIHLLLCARYEQDSKTVRKETLERGQIFTTYERLMDGLGWNSKTTLSRYLKILAEHGCVSVENKGKNGIKITVMNFEQYQDGEKCSPKNGLQMERKWNASGTQTEFLLINKEREEGEELLRDFGEFWGAYPPRRRNERDRAIREYASLRNDGVTHKSILKVLENAKCSRDWTVEEGRYIPSAWKWLSQSSPCDFKEYEREEDEEMWVTK